VTTPASCRRPSAEASGAPMPPCAVLDEGPAGKGFVVALFDPATNDLRGFLRTAGGRCGRARRRSRATSFATLKEAEAAAVLCKSKECPP
jgi:hypothetical protein